MSLEQDHNLIKEANYFGCEPRDWIEVAAATTRLTMADEAADGDPPTTDPDQRIEFSRTVAKQVVEHPKELVVFHKSETLDTKYHFLTAVIPDAAEPFELMPYSRSSRSDTQQRPLGYNLVLNPSEKIHPNYSVYADQQINFNNSNSDHTVWMGAGSRTDDRDPDCCGYLRQHNIAVGNLAVSQLMTDLATLAEANRPKVLGAAVHLGRLALDFESVIPAIPELRAEIGDQLRLLAANKQRSAAVVDLDSITLAQAEATCANFISGREQLAAFWANKSMADVPNVLPYIGDSRTWPFMNVSDYTNEANQLLSMVNQLEKELSEHHRRLLEYDDYEHILQALSRPTALAL